MSRKSGKSRNRKKPGSKPGGSPIGFAKGSPQNSNIRFYTLVLGACALVFAGSYFLFAPGTRKAERPKVQFVAPEPRFDSAERKARAPSPPPPAEPAAPREEPPKPLREKGSPLAAVPAGAKNEDRRNWPAFFDTLPDRPVSLENPDAYLQFARGMKLLEKAQIREARAHLARAVELSPQTGSYNAWYAYILYLTGRFVMGDEYLLRAKNLGYDDPLVYHYIGMILPPPNPDERARQILQQELDDARSP